MELKAVLRIILPLLVLIGTLHMRQVQSQLDPEAYGLTPNATGQARYCLVNRIEVTPCNFIQRNTGMPPKNQYGQYTTRIKSNSAGFPICNIRRRKHVVKDIPIFSDDERVKFIHSPGKRLPKPERYGNQIYVLYNVSCPAGHLAFFNISEISMEPPNCYNTASNQTLCVDYVRVIRPRYGTTESCGGDTIEDNRNQLEEGNLQILFRTSDSDRYSGFEASVICFDRGIADQEGCTMLTENGTTVDMSAGGNAGRRRRDLEEFHNKWKRHLAHMKRRRRRQAADFRFRFEIINVPFGVDVFYMDQELRFRLSDGGMEPENLPPRKGIHVVSTFDGDGITRFFVREALEDGRILALQGPGPLTIVGNNAYFQLFVIDPRGITPTPAEMVAISNLTQAQYALVSEENSTRQDPDVLNPPCINPSTDLNLPPNPDLKLSPECVQRRKRQAEISSMLEDSAVLTAIVNERSCNPVLRTSANATLTAMERDDAERLKRLRQVVANMQTNADP